MSQVSELMPGPPGSGLEMVEVGSLCGNKYQEGPPAGSGAPMCWCGTYAIGECKLCSRHICGEHSDMVTGRRRCTNCQAQQAHNAANARERKRQEHARDRESWPEATHADRVTYVSACPTPQLQVKWGRITGAELAACLLEGGVKPTPFLEFKQGLLTDMFGSRKIKRQIQGWTIGRNSPSDPDEKNFQLVVQVLATDGTQWVSSEGLKKVKSATEMYEGQLLCEIYQKSDTYYQRQRASR